jgi:hypothetical protein
MDRNHNHVRRRSHFGVVFGQLLSSYLHREEQNFLPMSLLFGQTWHDAIHVIDLVIVHCGNVMQCYCMRVEHPKGPISRWPQDFNDIPDNRQFILSCE